MKRHTQLSQATLNRILQEANAAWNQCAFQSAIDLLESARQRDPANSRILLELGRRHGLRYDYASAERCFEKAVNFSPNKTEILELAGRMSVDFASSQLAEHYFQRVAEQKDATPETCARLADFYERLRRNEDAVRMVNRALQQDANCALARLTQARLIRQTGQLEEAEQVVRPILLSAGREIQIRGYYELGAILDRQGRYDEAMTAYQQAKALLAPEAPPLLAQRLTVRTYLKGMEANLSGEALKRWGDLNPALPPASRVAFLGGYPRSGTTLLEQVLDSHPDIVTAEETSVFNDYALTPLRLKFPYNANLVSVLESAPPATLQQSRENYFYSMALQLGQPIRGRLLIDKNPQNNFLLPAFLRIFPEIKLLIALRDPRDVCMSCFMQPHLPLTTGSVAYLNLEHTVEAYAETMSFWRSLAPLVAGRFLEVRYEDMVEDLESVARQTLEFLGVPWDPKVLGFNETARKKMVRSPTYADVTQPIYKRAQGRWRKYQKYLEPHLARLEPFVKAFGYE